MSKDKPKKNGRPLREFDKKIVEGLCEVQCTINEIEAVLHTDQRILDKWCLRTYGEPFATIYKKYSQGGKSSLRRFQFNLARTNTAMAIWLGKQWLGQVDKIEQLEDKITTVVTVLDDLNRLVNKTDSADPETA